MISKVTIIGERSSGTNWLEAIFNGKSYYYNNQKFQRHKNFRLIHPEANPAFDLKYEIFPHGKHFFGFCDEKIKQSDDTLYVAIVRNFYDYLESFYAYKHHVPSVNKSMENFIKNEWYSVWHGKEYMQDRNWVTKERYKDIFELRKYKLKYLDEVMPNIANNYFLVRYEDMLHDVDKIVLDISEKFNLEIISKDFAKAKIKPKRNQFKKYRDYINNHLDWTIENKFNYYKQKA